VGEREGGLSEVRMRTEEGGRWMDVLEWKPVYFHMEAERLSLESDRTGFSPSSSLLSPDS